MAMQKGIEEAHGVGLWLHITTNFTSSANCEHQTERKKSFTEEHVE